MSPLDHSTWNGSPRKLTRQVIRSNTETLEETPISLLGRWSRRGVTMNTFGVQHLPGSCPSCFSVYMTDFQTSRNNSNTPA